MSDDPLLKYDRQMPWLEIQYNSFSNTMKTKPKSMKAAAPKAPAKKAAFKRYVTIAESKQAAPRKAPRPSASATPLEKDIEKKVCLYAKQVHGCYVRKFTSPAQRSVPDRLFITPSGRVFFIEFKRAGQVGTVAQLAEHCQIQNNKVRVFVVDDAEKGMELVLEQCAGL